MTDVPAGTYWLPGIGVDIWGRDGNLEISYRPTGAWTAFYAHQSVEGETSIEVLGTSRNLSDVQSLCERHAALLQDDLMDDFPDAFVSPHLLWGSDDIPPTDNYYAPLRYSVSPWEKGRRPYSVEFPKHRYFVRFSIGAGEKKAVIEEKEE